MKTVRIGAAQGFYGDFIFPAVETAQNGNVQYLCFDCLSELTMAILQKDRAKDPSKGYTKDITGAMRALLPYVKEKGLKILTNAGGINPIGARDEVLRVAKELGVTGIRVAVVTGDDVLPRLDEFRRKGISLKSMVTGEAIDKVFDRIVFANAYIGAKPIVHALGQGADIVITGRTTDSAQFLAPAIFELGWPEDDWDRLASGILMGHLLECSAQSTGGNYSRWWEVEGMENIGYPIAEMRENGTFIVTKTPGSGGLVTTDTVKEQMLYEIHDPSSYMTPDVVLDMAAVRLENAGEDQVLVSGAKGGRKPDTLKIVMGYNDGYMGEVIAGYSWPHAMAKARKADEIIRKQIAKYDLQFDEIRTDYIGYNSLHGANADELDENINEIYLRMAVRAKTRSEAMKLRQLFTPLGLNGPPGRGGGGGRDNVRQLLGMWSCLVPREEIERHIHVSLEEV